MFSIYEDTARLSVMSKFVVDVKIIIFGFKNFNGLQKCIMFHETVLAGLTDVFSSEANLKIRFSWI